MNSKKTDKLNNTEFPSYEEIKLKIDRKLKKRPNFPKDLLLGDWSPQAIKVLEERYLSKDKEGKTIETPDEMCWRVSWEIASAEVLWKSGKKEVEKLARKFYKMLVSKNFLPNSPTLMNAGTDGRLQYSGCYVLPVEDSLEGIFDSIKYQALIHQSGGGTGFSFNRLRPRGSMVGSSNGVASGPVSFMRIFDAATNEVKQGGRRRGANMGIVRVDHPDILEFIECKDGGEITNFNISVAITDKFMKALESNSDYDLINPKDNSKSGSMSAKEVFEKIAKGAHRTGDPGMIFIDRMNRGASNPVPSLGPIESTNPCGEQPLYPFDACNLGSVFLNYFVEVVDGKRQVDFEKLRQTVKLAVRFLDNVIEVNPYPINQIRETVFSTRRIGLGVGGWADLLIMLGIPYDSNEALKLAEKIMKLIKKEAIQTSEELAIERGEFSLWNKSIYKNKNKRRNSTVTTIAPTGSISIIANSSSGIEPIFAVAYQHIVKDKSLDRTLDFVNPLFESEMIKRGISNEEIRKKVVAKGVVRDIEELPEDIKKVFGTAHEIDREWHIKTQAIFQKYTENAVSKTINLRNSASVEDVKNAYLLAWREGCKGVTVFRDGCKDKQVLNLGVKSKEEVKEEIIKKVWERPMNVAGSTYKIKTPVGTAFITVNKDAEENPIEVFINVGRAGSDVQAMAEALGRLISKSLKFESTLTSRDKASVIIDQLKGIGGRRSVGFGPNKILSLPDAVAFALSSNLKEKQNSKDVLLGAKNGHSHLELNGESKNEKVKIQEKILTSTELVTEIQSEEAGEIYKAEVVEISSQIGDICPSCGSGTFIYQEGCSKCHACGYSEC